MQIKQSSWVLSGKLQKLVDQSIYLGSNILSTESDVNIRLAKAWSAIDRLLIVRQYDLSNKMKRYFFQAVFVLLHRCTRWAQTKRLVKKLDGNCTRIRRAVFNKSWKQHFKRQHFYDHLSYKLSNRTINTFVTVLEKKGQTHQRCSLMNSNTWAHQW